MRKSWKEKELSAVDAAIRLGVSRERVIRFIQTGRLVGRRDPEKGWLADSGAVEAAATTDAA